MKTYDITHKSIPGRKVWGTNWGERAKYPLLTLGLLAALGSQAQIKNGTTVYLSPGEELYIYEDMVNDATMTMGVGSLLHAEDGLVNNGAMTFSNSSSLLRGTSGSGVSDDGTGTGTYYYKRQGTVNPGVYNYWSAPMQVQVNNPIGLCYAYEPLNGTVDFADDAFDPGWYQATGNSIMEVGEGYASVGAGLVTFAGDVNNGTLSKAVSSYTNPNPSAAGTPFNLIGNPYPSGLAVASFINRNSTQLGMISGAVYLWDDPGVQPFQSQDYATINSIGSVSNGNGAFNSGNWNGSIAAGQGFMVEAITDGNVEFNNTMRTHDNAQFYHQQNLTRVWLNVENDDYYNETMIAFIEDATEQRDHLYDAKKVVGQMALSVFTMLDDDGYAIQAFPELTDLEKVVSLGTIHGQAGTYRFRLKEIQNWYEGVSIFLEDAYTGEWTNLLEDSTYQYEAMEGVDTERFKLHFLPQTLTSIDEGQELQVNVFQSMNDLIIDFSNADVPNARVALFDMLGQQLVPEQEYQLNGGRIRIPIGHLAFGNYIARVHNSAVNISTKFLKH